MWEREERESCVRDKERQSCVRDKERESSVILKLRGAILKKKKYLTMKLNGHSSHPSNKEMTILLKLENSHFIRIGILL